MPLNPLDIFADIEAVKARTHNLPVELQQEAIGDFLSEDFDRKTAKCETYLFGNQILTHGTERGYFDTLSLGNWMIIAHAAGVATVPARYLASASSNALFSDGMGNPRPDHYKEELEAMDTAIQCIKDNEILRFDCCASSYIKSRISEGKPEITGEAKGWIKGDDGEIHHVLCERLINGFLNATQPFMIAWARPIIKPRLIEGYSIITGKSGHWPCEWRIYVRHGKVVGVSNYYPQSSATDDDLPFASIAAKAAQQLADKLTEAKSSPHHPRYEDRVDTDGVHFSADFIVADNDNVLLLECGPDHFYSPHWGAHPCCFDPRNGIDGLALSQQDRRPLSALPNP